MNSDMRNNKEGESRLDFLLKKVTIKISTYFKGIANPECGSGVIYRTSNTAKFDYVFTALHCIRGDKLSGSSHMYDISDILSIKIEHKFDKEDNFVEEIIYQQTSIIEYEPGDFAIVLIPKQFGDKLEKREKIPEYYILKNRSFPYKYYRACGYPDIFNNEPWTTDAKLAPNGGGNYIHELRIEDIADIKALEKLGGFSGSGFFVSYKFILAGFARSLRDKTGYTNRLIIGRIDKINVNKLLSLKSDDLEHVRVIDNRSKLFIENDKTIIDYTKINIEGIELNLWNAIERVKNDLHDDWFEDPLKLTDILKPQFIYEKLNKYIKNQKIKYQPNDAVHFNVPKKGFTTRTATEINIIDRVVYQAFVDYIIKDFNEIIENRVYSGRFDTRDRDDSFFINPVEQWKKFTFQIDREMSSKSPFLVVADITSYYDSINIEILANQLKHLNHVHLDVDKEKKKDYDTVISVLNRLLTKWSRNGLKVGIPQNKDTSTFLANLLLCEVDKTMIYNKFNYYRFNDDIRIICDDRFEAQKALLLLINELNKIHLTLNSSKTAILHRINDIDEISKYLPKTDRRLEQINSLLSAKRARDVQVATKLTYDLFIESQTTGLDEALKIRYFNFYIERLQRFARNPFLKDLFPFDNVVDYLVDQLTIQPWNTDKIIDFFKALDKNEKLCTEIKKLILQVKQNIYDWQSYLLWTLLAYHKFVDKDLIDFGMEVIDNPNPNKKAETSAVAIYLASVAKPYYISKIKTSFDESKFIDHYTQRNVLISMKKIHHGEFNENFMLPAHRGIMQILNNVKGDYIKQLPILKPEEIYSDLPKKLISL